jgi:agmatinase
MLEIARTVCTNAAHVPVFDVVELAPLPGFRAPDFLAAKLVYKLFSYTLVRRGKTTKRRRSRNG